MAEQQFYQRPNFRKDEDHQVYDDAPLTGSQQGQAVSKDAQGTVDDIDALLNEVAGQEKTPEPANAAAEPKTDAKESLKSDEQNFTGSSGFRNEGPTRGSMTRRTANFIKRHKRGVAIGSSLMGLTVGGTITFSTLLTGPLQTIHLAQLLMKNNDSSSSASENRLNKLFRYARVSKTGDIGETRVGKVGSKVFGDTIQKLNDVGIEFQRNPRTGNPKSMTIDTSKNPEFKNMSREQARAAIAEKFGLTEDVLYRINSGGNGTGDKFAVNTRDVGIKATRALSKNSLTYLEDGKIVSSIRFRVLADFFNVPSLFHPLERTKAGIENKLATAAERRAAEKQRATDIEKPVIESAEPARASIKDKVGGLNGTATKALLFTGAMCIVRAVADDVVTVNRANIVVPSVLQAVDKQAVGSQVQYGDGFDSKQFDAVNESFVDNNGQSVFDGMALRSLDGNQLAGPDLNSDYRQAFSGDTTAKTMKDVLGGGIFGAVACSPIGQVIQGTVTIGIALSGFIDGGVSWTAFAAKEGAQFVASAAAVSFIEHQATAFLESKAIIPEIFSGPIGGNLLAFGAREAANTDIRAAGGIALSASEELAYNQQSAAAAEKEFQAKPLFARMFDTSDYRSGISRLADSLSPNALQDAAKISNGFANITSLIPSTLANLLPRAHAAEKTYDWGFPKYGIPQSMLDDTATEDPYDNADKVAAILDSTSGQAYIDKAQTCFGVDITNAGGDWDVKPKSPVNPNSDEYTSADCSNRSDPTWKRIVLFVFDTRTMKATACYEGDDASCDYSGFGQATTDSTGSNSTSGTLPSGSAKDLATQLLPYIKSNKINCSGQATDCPDIQKTASGQSIKGGSCYVDALDPQLLAIMLSLVQKGHDFIFSAICSDHPSNPNSKHHYGKGMDFNIVDGVWLGQNGDTPWTGDKLTAAQKLDKDITDVAPKTTGFGQVQCHPAFAFLQGFHINPPTDPCNHQHIEVQ